MVINSILSNLDTGAELSASDLIYVVQSGNSRKRTLASVVEPTATGSTTSRTLAARFSDILNVKDFGAVGDGVTDDTTAVDAAEAVQDKFLFIPDGSFKVDSYTAFNLGGNYWGPGKLVTTDGDRGNIVVRIDTKPSTLSNGGGLNSFYDNGIVSPWNFDFAITGADTVGQPTTGYVQYDQVHPIFIGMYNSSGHNESSTDADGRTGIAAIRLRVTQAGKGDCGAINANCVVTANDGTHTGLYGVPAGVLFNGNISATVSQVYLNPYEINVQDNGNDVRAVGHVINLDRGNVVAANGEYWSGVRVQAKDQQIDAGYQVIGPASVALDLTMTTIGDAAVALRADQFIHFDASATTLGGNETVADTFPGTRVGYESGDGGLNFYHTGSHKFSIGSSSNTNRQSLITTSQIRPSTDNATLLGGSSFRWSAVYSGQFRPGTGGPIWTSGGFDPEGTLTAPVGSLFTRTNGGASTTFYVKESGTGNTGWVAK